MQESPTLRLRFSSCQLSGTMGSCLCLASSFLWPFCCTVDYQSGVDPAQSYSVLLDDSEYAYKLAHIVSTGRLGSLHPLGTCAPCSPSPVHPSWEPWWDPGCSCHAAGEWELARGPPQSPGPPCPDLSDHSSTGRRSCPCSLTREGEDTALPACRHLLARDVLLGVLECVEQSYNFRSCLMIFSYIILIYRTYSFLPSIKYSIIK